MTLLKGTTTSHCTRIPLQFYLGDLGERKGGGGRGGGNGLWGQVARGWT